MACDVEEALLTVTRSVEADLRSPSCNLSCNPTEQVGELIVCQVTVVSLTLSWPSLGEANYLETH